MKRSFKNKFLPHALSSLLAFPIILSPAIVFADETKQRRFYFGGDLGTANMELQRGDTEYSGAWLYGALRAEYALRPQLLLGVEGVGWTDQLTSSSSISEDVTTFMMTARVYPLQYNNTFIKAGWGYAIHRYWESSVSSDASGTAYLVGLGYDIYNNVPLSVLYSSGDLDQETYKAFTVSMGFTF
jgi:hypothetical protein